MGVLVSFVPALMRFERTGLVENVDLVWTKIVKALADADAPLAKTGCVKTAKVAPVTLDGRYATNDPLTRS